MSTDSVSLSLLHSVKLAHRAFPTGVTVVTAMGKLGPVGLTVNAFSSVSLTPAIVLTCINQSSASHSNFFESDHFGVSILADDQAELALHFSKSGGDKFDGVDWLKGEVGIPLISGVAASLEMKTLQRVPMGTHTVLFGEIIGASVSGKTSLMYYDGKFHNI